MNRAPTQHQLALVEAKQRRQLWFGNLPADSIKPQTLSHAMNFILAHSLDFRAKYPELVGKAIRSCKLGGNRMHAFVECHNEEIAATILLMSGLRLAGRTLSISPVQKAKELAAKGVALYKDTPPLPDTAWVLRTYGFLSPELTGQVQRRIDSWAGYDGAALDATATDSRTAIRMRTLHISNLAFSVTTEQLKAAFEHALELDTGSALDAPQGARRVEYNRGVVSVNIHEVLDGTRDSNYGFVEVETVQLAVKAVNVLNGLELGSRAIGVKLQEAGEVQKWMQEHQSAQTSVAAQVDGMMEQLFASG